MNDLMQIQFITCGIFILVFAIVLKFRLMKKVFPGLELEQEPLLFLNGILVVIILYLSYIIIRNLWIILR